MEFTNKPSWNKARFEWKERIRRSTLLSGTAKLLAVCLCDQYVNKTTGRCWPHNKTIAEAIGKSERTVQRGLAELHQGGWIVYPRVRHRRRVIEITFPGAAVGDTKHDIEHGANMTNLTSKHDKDVAPYKNQVNIQVKGAKPKTAFGTVFVELNDDGPIKAWHDWIALNTQYKVADVFEAVKQNGRLVLPSRFPKEDAESCSVYQWYFERVM